MDMKFDELIAAFMVAEWPVIHVSESFHTNPWDEEEAPHFETIEYWVDTTKINDDFSIGYVMHILEAAVNDQTSISSSRKYSFGDTPDWWTNILIDSTTVGNRPVLHINVDVNL